MIQSSLLGDIMEFRENGHPWGIHRVLDPKGSLPQAATRLDPSLPLYDNELLVEINALQLDSASFRQLKGKNTATQIQEIIKTRGKMHNPVTNSGGVFLGKIAEIGPKHPMINSLQKGDPVVSLISLTLTPLTIHGEIHVDDKKERVTTQGSAILFETGIIAKVPEDLPEGLVLAVLDVCGAPAQAKRWVKSGEKVLILGLGKAGRLIALQCQINGASVFGIDPNPDSIDWCRKNLKGNFEILSATDPQALYKWVQDITHGSMVDMAFNATNVPNTEMSAILCTRDGGRILFFGMATSFQKAVLGAEGMGKDVQLIMGNGYVPGHGDLALNLIRNHATMAQWFGGFK